MTEVGAGLEDGKLEIAELRRIDREIGEAMQALALLRAAIHEQSLNARRKK